MKKFIEISRNVAVLGYGKFLSRLLVEKYFEVLEKEPEMIIKYSHIDFD